MKYLVVVDITPANTILKYQNYDSESEANAHATRVADTFPNTFVAQVDTDCLVDYLVADISNKTVTFDQARWDSDQNTIASTQYQRNRKEEYPSIEECVHAILDGELDDLQIKRQAVKEKYPKETS